MDIILVAGFWLGGWSWDRVAPVLRQAGHQVHTPTLPGLESNSAHRDTIGLADHVRAVCEIVDAIDGPVALVGHSGAGTVIHAVVDQRAGRIARAIYVDSGPTPAGIATNADLGANGGEITLPPWRDFSAADLRGMGDPERDFFRGNAIAEPAAVATDPQVLTHDDRFGVPVTLISTTYTAAEIDAAVTAGVPHFAELAHITDVSIVELPTGHWPQFSRPVDLARAILDAV